MLPVSQIIFTAALLARLVAATSSTACTPSVNGYGITSATQNAEDFCNSLGGSNSTSNQKTYGLPYITFKYSKLPVSSTCNANDCLTSYTSMFGGCQYNNLTIWGTAQMSSNCATYNYTIGNTTSPQLTPNATQVPGTAITPSPTGDAKGLTAVLSTTNNAGRVAKISGSLILGVAAIFISYL